MTLWLYDKLAQGGDRSSLERKVMGTNPGPA